jgi:threonine dehydrogenase-like Zn-dependent dehydrogenase
VFGVGGLGISAVQLARACGAREVFAVDVQTSKLELARRFGAIAVNARAGDPVAEIRRQTDGRGVDVALELIGLPLTMRQAVQVLGVFGRAVLVGITQQRFEVAPYAELINKEAEIIGVSDHLASEIPTLLEWTRQRTLDLAGVVTRTVPLEAAAINDALDELTRFGSEVRMVVRP